MSESIDRLLVIAQLHHDRLRAQAESLRRELAGYDLAMGVALSHLRGFAGFDPDRLLAELTAAYAELAEHDPEDPALTPLVRLEAMLRSQMGMPIESECLPKSERRGYSHTPQLGLVAPGLLDPAESGQGGQDRDEP